MKGREKLSPGSAAPAAAVGTLDGSPERSRLSSRGRKTTQTGVSRGTNPPRTHSYVAGLRGTPAGRRMTGGCYGAEAIV